MVSMQSAGYRIITVVLKMQLLIIQLIVQGTKGFLYRALRAFCHFTFTVIQCILKGSRFSGRRYSNEDENIVF